MYSQQAFQTRGVWPSALSQSNYNPHYRDSHDISPVSPLSRYSSLPNRGPPTPPEDMDALVPTSQHSNLQQELGIYYSGRGSRSYDGYDSRDTRQSHSGSYPYPQQHQVQHQSLSTQSSPTHSQQSITSNATQASRNASVTSLIAPSLQIPRTINNSQGSLAELAAQITCLFWFETSSTLDFAVSSPAYAVVTSPINMDTKPTTGFLKFVTMLLSTTQVAQNVVLLALLFIYRLKTQNPSVKGKLGSEYRLLTVALMLGNKFLDDNTYTNKTWADVSGISVTEVHIMEVEFLSNMKYNLFTTAAQWQSWQTQLGRFARFIEKASMPQPQIAGLAGLQTGFGNANLPSPPNSFQASPPRAMTPMAHAQPGLPMPVAANLPTARPSTIGPASYPVTNNKRKRSIDDDEFMTVPKRTMQSQSTQPTYMHPLLPTPASYPAYEPTQKSYSLPQSFSNVQQVPSYRPTAQSQSLPQLPPLSQQLGNTMPSMSSTWQGNQAPSAQSMQPMTSMGSMAAALRSAQASRTHSPYLPSTNVSPTNTSHLPNMTPQNHQSPSFFLRKRDSPYKPVRGVHTLLVPPPSRALHQPEQAGPNHMQFQPLGRPNERQQGRLPYIGQPQRYDPNQFTLNRPFDQWNGSMFPSSMGAQQLPVPQRY